MFIFFLPTVERETYTNGVKKSLKSDVRLEKKNTEIISALLGLRRAMLPNFGRRHKIKESTEV